METVFEDGVIMIKLYLEMHKKSFYPLNKPKAMNDPTAPITVHDKFFFHV